MNDFIPQHVAMIPDGNRRWAKVQGKTVLEGHERGVAAFQDVARHAADRGVRHLSLWGLSANNLTKRKPAEVAGLLNIFRKEFRQLRTGEEIHERQTRVQVFGGWREKFPAVVRREVEAAIEATKDYDSHFLNFFLVYNGTDEMVSAVREIVDEARVGTTPGVTGETIKQHLMTRDLPPVDLLIRTAGEPHLSAGFMMWEIADAELYFPKVSWPDFTPEEFDKALEFYTSRERRFGK